MVQRLVQHIDTWDDSLCFSVQVEDILIGIYPRPMLNVRPTFVSFIDTCRALNAW